MTLALTEKAYLLLPLLSALLYALSAIGLKAAGQRGVDLPRITVVVNWGTAIASWVFLKPGEGLIPDPWWPPVLIGVLFFFGQVLTFVALSRGDVSLATPLLSTKLILVAFVLAVVFHQPVSTQVWIGCVVALGGIVLLQASNRSGHWTHVTLTLIVSLLAAACYAMLDSVVQVWSRVPAVGYARLVPAGLTITAVLSLGLLPFSRTRWGDAARGAYGFLALGAALIVTQSIVLITAIGFYGDAAGCNIVYASRGVWSVFLVWWIGHHFGNHELRVARSVAVARLIGSVLVLAAIALAFMPNGR